MKGILPLAQKLFLTKRAIPQDPETVELLTELLEEIIRLDNENESLRSRIYSAQASLQEPTRVGRTKG